MDVSKLISKRANFGNGRPTFILTKEVISTGTTGLRLRGITKGNYVVDWGDGTVETRDLTSTGSYYLNSHSYSSIGRYDISFYMGTAVTAVYELHYSSSRIDTVCAKFLDGYTHYGFEFSNETALRELWLPSSVTPTASNFEKCTSLERIYCDFSASSSNAASAPWGAPSATVIFLRN